MTLSNGPQSNSPRSDQAFVFGPKGNDPRCELSEYGHRDDHPAVLPGEWGEKFSQTPQPLPQDVWVYLFEQTCAIILSTRDLFSVIQVSKNFYWAALRPLYRQIVWRDPMHFITSLPCFQRNPTEIIPRSLSISCSVLPPSYRSFTILHEGGHKETVLHVGGNFQNVIHTIHPRLSASHFVTVEVFSRMISIAKTFTHLEELSLTNHIISDDFYGILSHFPHLQSFKISSCHFKTESSISPGNFIALDPLKKLTLRNITYRYKPNFAVLVAAPGLTSLCFDRTSGDCLPVSGDTYKKLTFLQVYDTPGWTPQLSQQDTVMVALTIANHSPLVETLILDIPLRFPPPPNGQIHLPRSLKKYRGSADLLLKTISCMELQQILVAEIFNGHTDLDSVFLSISRSMLGLQQLAVVLENWDKSLPDALPHLQNLGNLTHIWISVGKPVPEEPEDFLDRLLLGLIPLVGLRSFHLHQRSKPRLSNYQIQANSMALLNTSIIELCLEDYGKLFRESGHKSSWRVKSGTCVGHGVSPA